MAEQDELIQTLSDVVKRLNALQIGYMVTGSVAMSSYVTARTTMDIDVIIEIRSSDTSRFEAAFRDDYYVDEASIRNAQERNSMFNVLDLKTGVKVDFILRKPTRSEKEKFRRRRSSRLGDIEYWVIQKEDLVMSKMEWAKDSHSEIQFRDIRNLIESGVDKARIDAMIADQGLQEVWKVYSEWKTRIEK
jgi:hypothetical protein